MHRTGTAALLVLLAVLAAFVWRSSQALPPLVASHFAASGAANSYMSRSVYTIVSILLVVGAPLFVAFLPSLLIGKGERKLNLPNRDYWLAPERREATLSFLRAHGKWFAAALAVFLTYAHWLVVQANALKPPVLAPSAILGGLAVFLAALTAWLVVLYVRFRKPA